MNLPYYIVDFNLTEEQKNERRHLLNYYGTFAQLSVLAPLLLLQCYFALCWVDKQWQGRTGSDVPSSPRAKSERSQPPFSSWKATLRKLQWWSSGPCVILGSRLGTKGEVVAASLWTAWLLLLSFLQTGNDYLHLTKRFGIVAASQIPFHYLLALKSPFSPLQLMTRCSHETLNNSHQLLGRIVTALLYLHAVLYINLYVSVGNLYAKIKEPYVICGICGIVAFTAVGTTALSPVRKWSYRVFYITHVSLATAILPLLFFHVSHIRVYLYETAAVYAFNAVARALTSHTLSGKLTLIPGTNLFEIDIPLKDMQKLRWQTGQHAYVSLSGHPLLRTFRSNPFTVASIPNVDGRLQFVARVLDGNTAKLAEAATTANTELLFTVEGPYGVATHPEALLRYDKVLFVAGGVGATFIVPLYRQLLADLSPGKGSYRRQRVNFVWTVRSKAETSWAIPADRKERQGFNDRLKVYVTGGEAGPASEGGFVLSGASGDVDGDAEEGIELEEQKSLLSRGNEGTQVAAGDVATYSGRPDLSRLVDRMFTHANSPESVAIVVCGPRSLSQELRTEVGKVARGRTVWLWDEVFAF